jgi:hypothetical protein
MPKPTNVIVFPKNSHARALTGARAAKAARFSAVRRENEAVLVLKIADHHSEGMRSRCHHLRTAVIGAPMSDANASCEAHSKITERKESVLRIDTSLGHIVLNDKADVSRDCATPLGDNHHMASKLTEKEERQAFIARTKLAREARYKTQNPMLEILDLDQGTYKQYETRTPLPHRFIPKFCAATGVEIGWLLTGRGQGPVQMPMQEAPRRKKNRRRAA